MSPDTIVLVATEIHLSCGVEASTAYLLEHAKELGVDDTELPEFRRLLARMPADWRPLATAIHDMMVGASQEICPGSACCQCCVDHC
jgi:hypothetical protein